jgi:oxygen-independent coproporphyrinogen-3 oxidase
MTIALLDNARYDHYEISNWAKRAPGHDFRCRHNLQYWLGYPYLGVGAGAHGFANGYRTINTRTIPDYIKRLSDRKATSKPFPGTPAQISMNEIDHHTQMMEFMMVGLRLVEEGVSEERFSQLFGHSMVDVFDAEIERLLRQGLVEWAGQSQRHLHLTKRGIMVANQVFMAFV